MAESNRQPIVLASGTESVALGGSATDSIIVAGNNNVISLTQRGALAFQFLSAEFRQQQAGAPGNPFYDGATPNWANIAHGDDAPRTLFGPLRQFALDQGRGAYKTALTLALAGEGKTTLLRRLAWSLAETGCPVLVRHHEHVVRAARIPISSETPLVLVFDDADQEEQIPRLAAELADNGVPFLLLMAARVHEWHTVTWEGKLKRTGTFKIFHLDRLDKREVEALLEKLSHANKLDALASLPRQQQVQHFLDRLKADGQLLPALLTARYGVEQFEAILLDVLEKIRRRPEGDFLLRAYAMLAGVHRYGLWLTRRLFADAMEMPEAEVSTRVIGPLEGELLEVQESAGERLSTRHPVIAERAMKILEEQKWTPAAVYLYEKIFAVLGAALGENPYDTQKKLLTILPLHFVRQGKFNEARQLFEQGTRADPTHAPTYQAWALMEQKLGHTERARQLFEQGTRADPTHAPTYQAWALMELGHDPNRCLQILEESLRKVSDPRGLASLYSLQGSAYAKQQQFEQAEAAFERAIQFDPREARSHYFFALRVLEAQKRWQEAIAHYEHALQLRPRPQDRRKIEEALKRCKRKRDGK